MSREKKTTLAFLILCCTILGFLTVVAGVTFAHSSSSASISNSEAEQHHQHHRQHEFAAAAAAAAAEPAPKFEAGASHLNIEGIQRGISVESIRTGKHALTLSLGGGSARFSTALSNDQRLGYLQRFISSAGTTQQHVEFGVGSWNQFKPIILGPKATTTVSSSGRNMKVVFAAAPDFDLDTPERVLFGSELPPELLRDGSAVSTINSNDFLIFPDGRLEVMYVDTGVAMVSHPVLLDVGLSQNANTSFPLRLHRGRDCRSGTFIMHVPWPHDEHSITDESTVVEFTPTVGAEQVTVCYVPQGEEADPLLLLPEEKDGGGGAGAGGGGTIIGGSGSTTNSNRKPPIYVAATTRGPRLSISGPLQSSSGARTVAVGENVLVQILGFNLTTDDVVAIAPAGECDVLGINDALQLPMYMASSSLAEATVQVQDVGVYDVCYFRDQASAFVPVASVSVTHTDGKHKTRDVNVSKGVNVELTGNIYSSNFRVLDGGIVRINSHQVNTTHFEWRDGKIDGWGGINCQLGPEPHVIAAAPNREVSVLIQNYGVMHLHVDHLHFTGQGQIYNHRHLTIYIESRKALIATADHFARRIVNGVRGRIDIVVGSAPDVAEVVHPLLVSTALFENFGNIVAAPQIQVKFRRVLNMPMGNIQLQTGSTVMIESGTIEGGFEVETDSILGFAGDVTLFGTDFVTADKTHIILNAVHYLKLNSVHVHGHANVVLHSHRTRGVVALEGTTTFDKTTILAIKNVSLSADRQIAYLNVKGRLICHVPSVELGDNIVMSAALNSVLFGSGQESARVVPQRVPPNNSAFVLPENASLYLVDVDATSRASSSSAARSKAAAAATTQVCAQYLVVPVHVVLSGDVQLLGCVMLPLGGQHSGNIYGSSASVIESTNKFAFCKSALSGGADVAAKKAFQDHADGKYSRGGGTGDNINSPHHHSSNNKQNIVDVPRDVCISLGSGQDKTNNVAMMLPSSSSSSAAADTENGLAFGGTHILDPHDSLSTSPQIKMDRVEMLPHSVIEAAAVVNLLVHRGILVRPESIVSLPLGGVIGSTILTIEGTVIVDAQFPLLINGTLHVEDTAKVVVRVMDDIEERCQFPLSVTGGCSFLEHSRLLVDGRGPKDLDGQTIPLLHADAGIIGMPLLNWSGRVDARGVTVHRGGDLGMKSKPAVELPTPYRKKLAIAFVLLAAAAASFFFVARIGTSFVTELLAEPNHPMHLGIAEFWASTHNWSAVLAALLEALFLCAPAFHHHLALPQALRDVGSWFAWMVSANHAENTWQGPFKYVSLFVLDFVFVVMWLWLYSVRSSPETQLRATPGWQRWFGYAQMICTYMTFLGLTFFIPIVATLMEPISCKFLFRGAFDCHYSEPYLIVGTAALVSFLILAPLSGTSLRTPFSHPPFMRDLDIRYKRTYIHLHCVLLGATLSCWKIFSRDVWALVISNLVLLLLMFALYRYAHPCIFENINVMRQCLFLLPIGASLAALIQLVRFEGVPATMCNSPVEYGYVFVFGAALVASFGMIIATMARGKSDNMPSFDPSATNARNAVLFRFSEVERIQLKMYNASTAQERARLAEDLAEKRVEYQQALQRLRKKLAPMQYQYYLGPDAAAHYQEEPLDTSAVDDDGIAGNNNNNNNNNTGGGGGNNNINRRDDRNSGGGRAAGGGGGGGARRNNINEGDDDNEELQPCMPDETSCIPASAVATPEELRELTPEQMSNYTEGPVLGRGTYGIVYMAMLSIGKLVAVKVVPIIKKQKAENLSNIKREVDVLRNMSHPNVIRCYGCSYPPKRDSICIFMELATSGSLTQIVRRFGGLNEAVVQVYTRQILKGLLYLHGRGVIHRDVKGENILVDGNGVAKLGDFGCSKFLADVANKSQAGCMSLVGSPFWMAPEVIRNEAYGTKADVWSLGCTIVEMLNGGHPPWSETFDNVYSAMFFIGNTDSLPSNIPENVSDLCKDLLHRCFDRDVSKRASVAELLAHPWLSDENNCGTSPLAPDMLHTPLAIGTGTTPSKQNGGDSDGSSDQQQRNGQQQQNGSSNNSSGDGTQQQHQGKAAPAYYGRANNNNGSGDGNNSSANGGANGGRGGFIMPGRGWSGIFDGVNSGQESGHATTDSYEPSTLSGASTANRSTY